MDVLITDVWPIRSEVERSKKYQITYDMLEKLGAVVFLPCPAGASKRRGVRRCVKPCELPSLRGEGVIIIRAECRLAMVIAFPDLF